MTYRMTEAQAQALLGRHYQPPKAAKGISKPKKLSEGERVLSEQLNALLIRFEREFKFCPDRRWRADFRISGTQILVEVEGGIWTNGRHTRGAGYQADMEKYNWAQLNGWTVLRYSTAQVLKGEAVKAVIGLVGEQRG